MKKVLTLFVASLLIISSCKDKEKPPVAVTGLSLTRPSYKMVEQETFKLEAIITPEEAADKSIEWASSNKDVATVADGLVTAVKAGTCTITAKSKSNTSLTAECLITVSAKEVPATSIKIEPATASVLVNETRPLIAIMIPANATDNVKWASSDEKKATVSPDGTVKGLVAGTVNITATSTKNPSVKGECQLTVTAHPIAITGLKLTPATVTLAVNGTKQLEITIEPKDATESVTYSSKAENIASVSNAGLITAKSGGTAEITAANKDGKITATCTVTVTVPVASITPGPAQAKVAIGHTLTLTVDVKPNDASNKTLTWKSSKQDVATVTQEGDKVKVTGQSAGTTTITATATDGSGVTGELLVTVPSNQAALLTLALGTEKFSVAVPTDGGQIVVVHAPRTIFANYTNLTKVPVTLTVSPNATIKIGQATNNFNSGEEVDFSNGATVTFTVKAEDGVTTKSYPVTITAYNATSNPYGVYTAAHLHDVRNDKAASYLMKNNITLPERNADGAAATGIGDYAQKGWLPIADDASILGDGTVTEGFAGKFDGGNFSIDNLYINRTTAGIGLFGGVSGATIQNLGVIGVTGTGPAVTGFRYVGALAGAIQGGSITNCYASANISLASNGLGVQFHVGGLLGHSTSAKISKSYSSGKISGNLTGNGNLGTGGFAGGVEGGDVTDCFATGDVTAVATTSAFGGGFAGAFIPTKATNCYATGNVTTTAQSASLGGFLGLSGSSSSTYTGCYRNSGALLTKNGNTAVSEEPSSTGITAKTKGQMQHDDFKGLLNGSGNIWGRDANKNDGLPYIKGVGVGK